MGVGDNVDHNLATLDGQGTFHGISIIAVTTSKDCQSCHAPSQTIKRYKSVNVHKLHGEGQGNANSSIPGFHQALVTFKPIIELQVPYTLPLQLCSDTLWQSGWIFSEEAKPRPNWSDFMQHIFSDSDDPIVKSEVLFLLIADLNPSDETCIYSTLAYIQKQAEHSDCKYKI